MIYEASLKASLRQYAADVGRERVVVIEDRSEE